jgi:DNA replication protein DnaC
LHGIVNQEDTNPKAGAIFSYMRECDLIIIDDVFYIEPSRAELQAFYRVITFLNETRSIIFITNREISAWLDAAEDKHLCQTLLDRVTANCQIIRLTDR